MRFSRQTVGGFLPRVLLLALAIAMLAEPLALPVVARDRQGVGAEIVGGRAVAQGTDTFMTLILIDVGRGTVLCGGSLIAPSYVLTAAHCVEDDNGTRFDKSQFHLFIGRASLSIAELNGAIPGANVRGVSAIAQHPRWNPVTTVNDIAVLTLDKAVPASVAKPLSLTVDARFDKAGEPVSVAGWGATAEGKEIRTPLRLREASLKVTGDAACVKAYGDAFDPATEICASSRGKDSCSGDSGGPLFASVPNRTKSHRGESQAVAASRGKHKGQKSKSSGQPVAIGVVSFGKGCARPGFPGVYTRLSAPSIHAFVEGVVGG